LRSIRGKYSKDFLLKLAKKFNEKYIKIIIILFKNIVYDMLINIKQELIVVFMEISRIIIF
jgi:hypothetical protein